MQVYTEAGASAGTVSPDASGNYLTSALHAGRYYIRTHDSAGFIDEVYDNLPCSQLCSVTAGTPIDVVAGAITSGRNFALTQGGHIAGTVRDAGTNALLAQIRVAAVLADGTLVKVAATNSQRGLRDPRAACPAPTTSALRSRAAVFYLDELWNEVPCSPTCTVTDWHSPSW